MFCTPLRITHPKVPFLFLCNTSRLEQRTIVFLLVCRVCSGFRERYSYITIMLRCFSLLLIDAWINQTTITAAIFYNILHRRMFHCVLWLLLLLTGKIYHKGLTIVELKTIVGRQLRTRHRIY